MASAAADHKAAPLVRKELLAQLAEQKEQPTPPITKRSGAFLVDHANSSVGEQEAAQEKYHASLLAVQPVSSAEASVGNAIGHFFGTRKQKKQKQKSKKNKKKKKKKKKKKEKKEKKKKKKNGLHVRADVLFDMSTLLYPALDPSSAAMALAFFESKCVPLPSGDAYVTAFDAAVEAFTRRAAELESGPGPESCTAEEMAAVRSMLERLKEVQTLVQRVNKLCGRRPMSLSIHTLAPIVENICSTVDTIAKKVTNTLVSSSPYSAAAASVDVHLVLVVDAAERTTCYKLLSTMSRCYQAALAYAECSLNGRVHGDDVDWSRAARVPPHVLYPIIMLVKHRMKRVVHDITAASHLQSPSGVVVSYELALVQDADAEMATRTRNACCVSVNVPDAAQLQRVVLSVSSDYDIALTQALIAETMAVPGPPGHLGDDEPGTAPAGQALPVDIQLGTLILHSSAVGARYQLIRPSVCPSLNRAAAIRNLERTKPAVAVCSFSSALIVAWSVFGSDLYNLSVRARDYNGQSASALMGLLMDVGRSRAQELVLDERLRQRITVVAERLGRILDFSGLLNRVWNELELE